MNYYNGNNVKYVYDMAGNKLRTTHYTAQLVPVQTPLDLTTSAGQASSTTGTTTSTTGSASSTTTPATRVTRILVKSAETLYIGADIQIDTQTGTYTYLFGGGYAEFNPTAATDTIRYYYYTKDHLGNIRNVLTKNDSGDMEEIQRTSYYPFGGIIATDSLSFGRDIQDRTYNGKEQDFANNLFWLDYGARQYDPTRGQFTTPDPLAEKYYATNYFTYCMNNPMNAIDPDGREPIKKYVGTAQDFAQLLNNSPRHVGKFRGQVSSDYMKSLSNTEWKWSQMRPIPTQTPYFNQKKGRYIYTQKGGWLDMAHFMFYAGKAYNYTIQKKQAETILNSSYYRCLAEVEVRVELEKQANMDPVSESIQDGYHQELSDSFVARQSAYSYEDLPSDKLGAIFGACFFDPNSNLTLSEQLINYLKTLGATTPENAPNFKQLPSTESEEPSRTNKTTIPVYTDSNP